MLAVDHVNLEVADQEFVCLVGSSGCGKSTLLNIIAGLDLPTSGTVEIDHEPIVGPGPDRGMVFQTYSLYPWRTVAENVAFGLECVRMRKAQRAERVEELLGIVGLSKFADHTPDQLSGGMRQRVAIARGARARTRRAAARRAVRRARRADPPRRCRTSCSPCGSGRSRPSCS